MHEKLVNAYFHKIYFQQEIKRDSKDDFYHNNSDFDGNNVYTIDI